MQLFDTTRFTEPIYIHGNQQRPGPPIRVRHCHPHQFSISQIRI